VSFTLVASTLRELVLIADGAGAELAAAQVVLEDFTAPGVDSQALCGTLTVWEDRAAHTIDFRSFATWRIHTTDVTGGECAESPHPCAIIDSYLPMADGLPR
jgi:hypothetical protein